MFTVDSFPHGHFAWADGQSTDIEKTKAFYTAVMGWSYEDIPIGDEQGSTYTMFQKDGHNICGAGQMQADMMEMGVPSMWTSHVKVDDVGRSRGQGRGVGRQSDDGTL